MLPSITVSSLLWLSLFYLFRLCEATSLGPGARQGTCATVYNNTLYVWGGTEDNITSPAFTYANFTSTYLPLSTAGYIPWIDLSWNIPPYLANSNQTISIWPCLVSPTGILVVGGNNLFGYDLVHNTYVLVNTTGINNPIGSLTNRTNYRTVQVEDSVYVFGGYSGYGLNTTTAVPQTDMYILNLTSWEWSVSSVNNSQSIPPNYDWPTLAYGGDGFIYMFGGSQNSSIGEAVYYSDIYKFDINARSWSPVSPYGSPVSGFDDAPAAVYKGKVYIFEGGTNNGTSGVPQSGASFYSGVVRFYDIVSNTYSVQTSYNNFQNAAPPEVHSSIALSSDAVIIVSGQTSSSRDAQGVWVYNLTVQDWTTTVAEDPRFPNHFKISTTAPSTTSSTTSSISLSPTITSTPPVSNSPNIGVIVGSTVGGLVVGAVAAFSAAYILIGYIRRRQNEESPEPQPQPQDSSNFNNLAQPVHDKIPSINYADPLYALQTLGSHKPDDVPCQKPDDNSWQNSNNIPWPKPDDVSVRKPDNMYIYIPHKPDENID